MFLTIEKSMKSKCWMRNDKIEKKNSVLEHYFLYQQSPQILDMEKDKS